MKPLTERATLIFIMIVCLYFGYEVLWSGAILGLKIVTGVVLSFIILACLDAFITLSVTKGGLE